MAWRDVSGRQSVQVISCCENRFGLVVRWRLRSCFARNWQVSKGFPSKNLMLITKADIAVTVKDVSSC